jgi:hypothetical protein
MNTCLRFKISFLNKGVILFDNLRQIKELITCDYIIFQKTSIPISDKLLLVKTHAIVAHKGLLLSSYFTYLT